MIRLFDSSDEARVADIWLQAGLDEYSYLPNLMMINDRICGLICVNYTNLQK